MTRIVKIECDNCNTPEIGREMNMTKGAKVVVYGDAMYDALHICSTCLQEGLLLSLGVTEDSYSVIKIAKGVAKK